MYQSADRQQAIAWQGLFNSLLSGFCFHYSDCISQTEVTLEVLDGDESLVDLQLSLAAHTEIVMKNLCDTVPKLVYNQLVTKVRE